MPRSASAQNPNRNPTAVSKDAGQLRSKSTIKRLLMYKGKALKRNRQGKIVDGDLVSNKKSGNKLIDGPARVAPNRRWFGNTRLVGAKELDEFRSEMSARVADPYAIVLKRKRVPMGLLNTTTSSNTTTTADSNGKILDLESYDATFGPQARRKRPNLNRKLTSVEELADRANSMANEDRRVTAEASFFKPDEERPMERQRVFDKGQSRRIWTELYKVLDCSDVVLQVLDARDPMGTRSKRVEEHLKSAEARHKHLVFVLNKVDLVPTWVTRHWVRELSKEYPTLAFHAHVQKPFGKGALISLLRQFSLLHSEKKSISVGIIGYPNVGKSSLINTLSGEKVSNVSPIPGETKVWQYVTLYKRINLIDCPGVVYETQGETETNLVFKGVVRAEKLDTPEEFIPDLMTRVRHEYLSRVYGVPMETTKNPEAFLAAIAKKRGRLLKGAEPDVRSIAQQLLYDLQRGRIPYFVPPTKGEGGDDDDDNDDATTSKVQHVAKGVTLETQNFEEIPQFKFLGGSGEGGGGDGDVIEEGEGHVWNELDLN